MNISFTAVGSVIATFTCKKQIIAGHVVCVSGSKLVDECDSGGVFDGVVFFDCEVPLASVQVRGFVEVKIPENECIYAGREMLVADGEGGVRRPKLADEIKNAREYLVVEYSKDGYITILL